MELVDVYVNRRPIGHAYMQDDRLEAAMTLRGKRRTRLSACATCPHERVVQAFAHRRSSDEHWPIAYCVDCFAIVAGVDPFVHARRPRWKHDERNMIISRWTGNGQSEVARGTTRRPRRPLGPTPPSSSGEELALARERGEDPVDVGLDVVEVQ